MEVDDFYQLRSSVLVMNKKNNGDFSNTLLMNNIFVKI